MNEAGFEHYNFIGNPSGSRVSDGLMGKGFNTIFSKTQATLDSNSTLSLVEVGSNAL